MNDQYDLIIVGGGLVGASLALALAPLSWRIAILESQAPFTSSVSDRAIALSLGSQRIFKTLNVWQELESQTSPIKKIHISDQGRFGALRLNAEDYDLFSFGSIVNANRLLTHLHQQLSHWPSIRCFFSSELTEIKPSDSHVDVQFITSENSGHFKTQFIIAADGSHSTVRECLKLPMTQHDYVQDALVGTISSEFDHFGCAYERMTKYGTLAVLPRDSQQESFVWTMPKHYAQQWAKTEDPIFLRHLQNCLGGRLGKFINIKERAQFPLNSLHMPSHSHPRVAFIGNAAHTLHPIAAQGFNLGLRDAAILAEILVENDIHSCQASSNLLSRYHQQRQQDQNWTRYFTQSLVEICSLKTAPFIFLRDMGLILFDMIPSLQQQLAQWGMTGFSLRQPKLACEIPLHQHSITKEKIYVY